MLFREGLRVVAREASTGSCVAASRFIYVADAARRAGWMLAEAFEVRGRSGTGEESYHLVAESELVHAGRELDG